MKIFLQTDDITKNIEVTDEAEFNLMVEYYYKEQVNWAIPHRRDPAKIS